ncbi:MAG: hypothetical protein AVO38_03715 [delta proteobacterium ML8_D]|jgi:modulator of FtsH protease HflK|nr:MAG: hypothetical protein AVO38_03715 [delta proteobacterium ML8_D]
MNDKDNRQPRSSYLDYITGTSENNTVSSLDSLSSALKVGFKLLKILMLVLAVVFFFSNIFWVPEGYVAVLSRFGKIVGERTSSARPPGGPYLAFPYPVDHIIRIPTTIQKVSLFNSFWSEKDTFKPIIDDRPETDGLRPGVEGSLVTADKNIVQGIWVIHYKLNFDTESSTGESSVNDFIRNVGSMIQAEEIIRRVAEASIVRVVSQTSVAEFVSGQIDNNKIKRIIATHLERLKTGLTVTNVSASHYTVPKALEEDFEAVTQAESQKALDIETASRHRASTLNELAGRGWQELLDAVKVYEQTLQNTDETAEKAAFEVAKEIFLAADTGGSIKQILNEAQSEKTVTIQEARASAARFSELLTYYEKNPDVLQSQLIKDVTKKIWSGISVDAFYIPKGQKLFLDLGQQDSIKLN